MQKFFSNRRLVIAVIILVVCFGLMAGSVSLRNRQGESGGGLKEPQTGDLGRRIGVRLCWFDGGRFWQRKRY